MPLPFNTPLTLVVKVIDGVDVGFAIDPLNPFAVTNDTEVTVPPDDVDEIVMEPDPFVIDIPDPAVNVVLVKPPVEVLPISNWPFEYDVCPVPP